MPFMTAPRRRSLAPRISGPMTILRRSLYLFLDRVQFLRRQFLLAKKRQDQLARRAREELGQQLLHGLSSGRVPIHSGRENESAPLFAGRKITFPFEYGHER